MLFFALPFSSLPWFKSVFGEFSGEGAFYIGIVIVLMGIFGAIYKGCTFYGLTSKPYNKLIIFVTFAIFISFFSLADMVQNINKGRLGIERFISQSLILVFILSFVYFFSALLRGISHRTILHWIMISLAFPLIVGTFQLIGHVLDNQLFQEAYVYIYQIVGDPSSEYIWRIRSVSFESSFFGIWVGFILPWVFVAFNTVRGLTKFLYLAIISTLYVLLVYSGSRIGLLISIVVTVLYILVPIHFTRKPSKTYNFNKRIVTYAFVTIFILLCLFFLYSNIDLYLSFEYGAEYADSNVARLSTQLSALSMGIDNLITGVGLGQFGIHYTTYYPDFLNTTVEINEWRDSSPETPWPPVHSLYARIFAELGVLGLALWASFILALLNQSKVFINTANSRFDIRFWTAHYVSIIGIALAGFSSDSFRFFYLWILLSIQIAACPITYQELSKK